MTTGKSRNAVLGAFNRRTLLALLGALAIFSIAHAVPECADPYLAVDCPSDPNCERSTQGTQVNEPCCQDPAPLYCCQYPKKIKYTCVGSGCGAFYRAPYDCIEPQPAISPATCGGGGN